MSKASAKRQRAARLARAIDRLAKLVDNGELLAATDPAALLDAVCSRVDEFERRIDNAATRLGEELTKTIRLERELAIARAAIPETVTCSGCDLIVLVSSLHWGTRATHYGRHGEPCGSWTKDGQPWVVPCEHPADVVDQQMEVGE